MGLEGEGSAVSYIRGLGFCLYPPDRVPTFYVGSVRDLCRGLSLAVGGS